MKCHEHYEREAVSKCLDCGRGLCPECTNKWSIIICDNCNLARAGNDKKQVMKNVLLMVPLFILAFWYTPAQAPFANRLTVAYMAASIPWGWGALNRITPNIFLFLPLIGWVFYFAVKLAIATVIGEIILPYKIFMFIKNYRNAQQVQNQIKNSI